MKRPNIMKISYKIVAAVSHLVISFGSDEPMPPERISARFAEQLA